MARSIPSTCLLARARVNERVLYAIWQEVFRAHAFLRLKSDIYFCRGGSSSRSTWTRRSRGRAPLLPALHCRRKERRWLRCRGGPGRPPPRWRGAGRRRSPAPRAPPPLDARRRSSTPPPPAGSSSLSSSRTPRGARGGGVVGRPRGGAAAGRRARREQSR
jgi:hypothetical protein